MNSREKAVLEAAAIHLQDYAEVCRGSARVDGQWSSEQARKDYVDIMMRTLQLRQMVDGAEPYEYPLHRLEPAHYVPRVEYKQLAPGRPRKV